MERFALRKIVSSVCDDYIDTLLTGIEENEERQTVTFKDYGIDERNIYIDKQSRKDFDREQYNILKHILRENDIQAGDSHEN